MSDVKQTVKSVCMVPSDGYRKRAYELRNLTQIIPLSFEEELKRKRNLRYQVFSFNNSPTR